MPGILKLGFSKFIRANREEVLMRCERMLIRVASVFALILFCGTLMISVAQESEVRLAHSDGNGTLKIGEEQFKITSVVVKLLPDHKAEINLVSDITVFLNATWSNHDQTQADFDLEITGGGANPSLEGKGKVSLSDDSKSVRRLTLKGVSRNTKRAVEANFEGK